MSGLIKLIPPVSANSFDALAQPTFGTIEVSNVGGTVSSILLTADKTSVGIGERFTVKVKVTTNTLTVKEYRIVIKFDSASLSVIDQDNTTPGTQITLLDQVFQVEEPEVNNSVAIIGDEGTITLLATAPEGSDLQVNTDVAEIEFQAQAEGSAPVQIIQGTEGSRLTRGSGTSLNFTTNEITIQASDISVVEPPPTTQEPPPVETPPSETPPAQTPPTTTTPPPTVEVIPNTALGDEFGPLGSAISLGLGFVLVVMGMAMLARKERNLHEKKED